MHGVSKVDSVSRSFCGGVPMTTYKGTRGGILELMTV